MAKVHQGKAKADLKKVFFSFSESSSLSALTLSLFSVSPSEDPTQIGKGIALITVQDINDNAPVFAIDYETILCENAMPGQVRPRTRLPAVGPASLPLSSPGARLKPDSQRPPAAAQRHSKTLSCSSKQSPARGHPRETMASLVRGTSIRFNSRCKWHHSWEI